MALRVARLGNGALAVEIRDLLAGSTLGPKENERELE
jgi:hypothetical protein